MRSLCKCSLVNLGYGDDDEGHGDDDDGGKKRGDSGKREMLMGMREKGERFRERKGCNGGGESGRRWSGEGDRKCICIYITAYILA